MDANGQENPKVSMVISAKAGAQGGNRHRRNPLTRPLFARGAVGLLITVLAVGASSLAGTTVGQAATPPNAASTTDASGCPNVSSSMNVPVPPAGYAYIATTTLLSDCTFSQPELTLVANAATPATGDEATSHYRLWDCCGNKLNASATTINWTTSGGHIATASSIIHDYWFPDGWVQLNLTDNWTGGCVGCSSISATGFAEFLYAPGPVFQNWDWNYITADGNGGYSNCSSSWVWNLGFPGWSVQAWCQFGYGGT